MNLDMYHRVCNFSSGYVIFLVKCKFLASSNFDQTNEIFIPFQEMKLGLFFSSLLSLLVCYIIEQTRKTIHRREKQIS